MRAGAIRAKLESLKVDANEVSNGRLQNKLDGLITSWNDMKFEARSGGTVAASAPRGPHSDRAPSAANTTRSDGALTPRHSSTKPAWAPRQTAHSFAEEKLLTDELLTDMLDELASSDNQNSPPTTLASESPPGMRGLLAAAGGGSFLGSPDSPESTSKPSPRSLRRGRAAGGNSPVGSVGGISTRARGGYGHASPSSPSTSSRSVSHQPVSPSVSHQPGSFGGARHRSRGLHNHVISDAAGHDHHQCNSSSFATLMAAAGGHATPASTAASAALGSRSSPGSKNPGGVSGAGAHAVVKADNTTYPRSRVQTPGAIRQRRASAARTLVEPIS